QQLESAQSQDVSVNDCFKPVSRYWDRITRPEQIVTALPEAMRTLTSPAETGAVTLALPQDVQAEAYDYPAAFFAPRVWTIPRAANVLARDADLVVVVGSRLSDFTTASKTAFQHERVRFIGINVAELDAFKHAALPLVGDARAVLEELTPLVAGYRVSADYTS